MPESFDVNNYIAIMVHVMYCSRNVTFIQYFDTVGWVFWPVKTVSHILLNITYFLTYSFA